MAIEETVAGLPKLFEANLPRTVTTPLRNPDVLLLFPAIAYLEEEQMNSYHAELKAWRNRRSEYLGESTGLLRSWREWRHSENPPQYPQYIPEELIPVTVANWPDKESPVGSLIHFKLLDEVVFELGAEEKYYPVCHPCYISQLEIAWEKSARTSKKAQAANL